MINNNSLNEIRKKLKILCVEDDPVTRQRMELYLKKYFNTVYVATDGAEGLKRYKQNKPDIVITDIMMPNLNGLDMSDEIKKLNSYVKVLVISAHDDKEYLMRSLNIGVDGYITKPIKTNELTEALNRLIKSIAISNDMKLSKEIKHTDTHKIEEQTKEDFFKIFQVLKENDLVIKTISKFKGLILSTNSLIEEIKDDKIVIVCEKLQATMAKSEKNIILHNELFKQDVFAEITTISKQKNKYVLEIKNFKYMLSSPSAREEVRLIPKEDFLASLFYKSKPYHVKVVDISLKAFSLTSENILNTFNIGDEVELKLIIPKKQKTIYNETTFNLYINCKGIITKIDEDKIVVFTSYKNQSDKNEINTYLVSRQKEIIEELKTILLQGI
ncbi:response regulator [Arcobacter sp. FWKO B]|uniref:response regulator n=1 Tax=Arcobacter sp. FWKO B TaxID=2593672 RepID=UPI0018A476F4|nr:response regulator [Arcobacter sp. FWKO B]QOG12905.1 response regulator [Arcobacter sp. FWKO B]